jgi:hypothetical protein
MACSILGVLQPDAIGVRCSSGSSTSVTRPALGRPKYGVGSAVVAGLGTECWVRLGRRSYPTGAPSSSKDAGAIDPTAGGIGETGPSSTPKASLGADAVGPTSRTGSAAQQGGGGGKPVGQ